MILLTTSEENGLCYIETAELDGLVKSVYSAIIKQNKCHRLANNSFDFIQKPLVFLVIFLP